MKQWEGKVAGATAVSQEYIHSVSFGRGRIWKLFCFWDTTVDMLLPWQIPTNFTTPQ